jgi:hypothetical protein
MSKDFTSHDSKSTPEAPKDHPLGCLVRLFWMVAGYLVLIFAAVSLWSGRSAWGLSVADLTYWAGVVALVGARYADVAYLGGKTSDGQQSATMADWRRYSLWLGAVTLAVWLLLHAAIGYRA